jgi:hypothetical protein
VQGAVGALHLIRLQGIARLSMRAVELAAASYSLPETISFKEIL